MGDAGTRQMQTDEPLHSFPCPLAATTLTPPTDHRQPVPSDPVNETTQAVTVARDGVIVQPGLHNTPQPAIRFADRQMPLTGFARMPKPSSASEHGSKRVEPKNSSTKQLTSRRNLPTDADKPRIRPTIACCPFGQLHARRAARWTCAGSGSVSGASRACTSFLLAESLSSIGSADASAASLFADVAGTMDSSARLASS